MTSDRRATVRLALAAAAALAVAVFGAAPAHAQEPAWEERVARLEEELRLARAEVAKLLRKLAEAETRYEAERRRADELERRLEQRAGGADPGNGRAPPEAPPRTGAPSPPPAGHAGRAADEVRFFTLPARQINSLGLVVRVEKRLSDRIAGAKSVALEAGAATGPLSFETDPASGALRILAPDRRSKVALARIELRDETPFWSWESFSPTSVGDETLLQLDLVLRIFRLEVHGDGLVAPLQQEPVDIEVAVGGRPDMLPWLPPGSPPLRLEPDRLGDGWSARSIGDAGVRFARQGVELTVALDPAARTIGAAWEPALTPRMREIDEQIESWEEDLERLRRLRPGDPNISRIEKEVEALRRERANLAKKAGPPPGRPTGRLDCGARIVLEERDLVLYRIQLASPR